jgi:uncharacterized protein (DUF1501 family)
MSPHQASRREFLRKAAVLSGSVGTAGLPLALNLSLMNNAVAQATGYKAIVCLFLYGGNDSANMVLPTDATSWASYSSVRSTAPDPIALLPAGAAPDPAATAASPAALGGALPIVPNFTVYGENSARTFALHPSMSEAQALFTQGRLAILANAGTLIAPMTKVEYQANTAAKPRPPKLFSHNDQQSVWQALAPEGARVGWGGRFGDLVASNNANTAFTNISASGNAVFMSGQTVFQYQVGNGGAVAIGGLTGNLFGSGAAAASLRSIITADNQHLFAKEHAAVVKRSIDAQAVFQSAFTGSTVTAPTQYLQPSTRALANNSLATQLQTVARIIGARTNLGMQRQVFFVSMGGFDTHDNQNRAHADLMARLSHALAYFDTTMATMGMRDSVTLFTASDFGRTFTSNGDGTDHGWGAHHFVLGGAAVRGKEIFGRFPTVGLNHSDEVGSGNLLPGISVEQIGSGVGKWFGLSDGNLDTVFPNLKNFQRDLGFITA